MTNTQTVGVIGAGSFGTAVANLLSENSSVILATHNAESSDEINSTRKSAGQDLAANIHVTHRLDLLANSAKIIFPIIPSHDFYQCMVDLKPHLRKDHILIHGTKGLHLTT